MAVVVFTSEMPQARYRDRLPQLDGGTFLTDAGLETVLVFHDGMDLPAFAAFPLVAEAAGRARLVRYYEPFLATAREVGATGVVLETPTWRANPDWAAQLGYSPAALTELLDASVELLDGLRATWGDERPAVISGCVGPRGDGYQPDTAMTADEAAEYHAFQIDATARTSADMVTAMTIGTVDEAVGITQAAAQAGIPAVISFTVETDGRLPSGVPLGEAIEATDAATACGPAYYMVNCAHPTHFADEVASGGSWTARIRGLRANASTKSHAELDEATTLDDGDPADLAERYVALRASLPALTVVGGCCGTDHRHVEAIGRALLADAPGPT